MGRVAAPSVDDIDVPFKHDGRAQLQYSSSDASGCRSRRPWRRECRRHGFVVTRFNNQPVAGPDDLGDATDRRRDGRPAAASMATFGRFSIHGAADDVGSVQHRHPRLIEVAGLSD